MTDNWQWIVGVDEAGRGPLAGPVVAAAVVLDPETPIDGLADSKSISEKKREQLFEQIKSHAKDWCIAQASVEEIDQINILQASLLAMKRAIQGVNFEFDVALIDGNKCPDMDIAMRAAVQGDKTEPAISAASILAKVTRDRMMLELDQQYPHYGFAKHKGYPTKVHLEAIRNHGITEVHRKSYKPVAMLMKELATNE